MLQPLKNNLFKLGYYFEEIAEGVILIPNFFTDKDFEPLWQIIESATQEDWEKDYRDSQIELAERKFGRTDIDNLIEEGLMEYTYNWNDKAIAIPQDIADKLSFNLNLIFDYTDDFFVGGLQNIQRQYEDSPLIEHVDNAADPEIEFAAIGYMNDDYTDGELFFSRLGVEIKPKARSLILFPGGDLYSHGVKSPGKGPVRYALPTFIYRKPSA